MSLMNSFKNVFGGAKNEMPADGGGQSLPQEPQGPMTGDEGQGPVGGDEGAPVINPEPSMPSEPPSMPPEPVMPQEEVGDKKDCQCGQPNCPSCNPQQ